MVRAWRRELYASLSATVIVPGALLAALAVLALAGGFARIGSLGQAFSGPPLPAASASAQTGARASRAASTAALLALAAGARTFAGAVAVAPSIKAPAHGGSGATHGHGAPGTGVHAHQPAKSSTRSSQPLASPAPHPTLIDEVVSQGTSVSRQLPAPAGPAATQALQSAGSSLDGVAPVPPPGQTPSRPAVPTGAPAQLP
jgi:hypothetical protein